jgi:hypothetical protein
MNIHYFRISGFRRETKQASKMEASSLTDMSTHEIRQGMTFNSYVDFEKAVNHFATAQHAVFITKDCKTLESANKKLKVPFPADFAALKYSFVHKVCKHFGAITSKSTGLRPNQRFVVQ